MAYRRVMAVRSDIRLTFNQVPELYDSVRPTYPEPFFDTLFDALAHTSAPSVVEVGPGTGQATTELVKRGAHVTAIELGPDLAAFVERKFEASGSVTVINAAFEDAAVPIGTFDAVVCSCAYHWIDAAVQATRPAELLLPGGHAAIIDLIQVSSDVDGGYFDRAQPIYERYGQARSEPFRTYESAQPQIANVLQESGLFASVDVHRERWDQSYASADYRRLLSTYSGTLMMPEPQRRDMVDELVGLIDDEFDGHLVRPLLATLTLAQKHTGG